MDTFGAMGLPADEFLERVAGALLTYVGADRIPGGYTETSVMIRDLRSLAAEFRRQTNVI